MDLYVSERMHTATAAPGEGTAICVRGYTNVTLQAFLAGTPNVALIFEGAFDADGTDGWFPVLVEDAGGSQVSSLGGVASGFYHLIPNGCSHIRARVETVNSGTLTLHSGRFKRANSGMDYYANETLHSAAVATGNGTAINVRGMRGVTIAWISTGTPVGTLAFQGTVDDTTWQALALRDELGGWDTEVDEASLGKCWHLPDNHGLSQVRVVWTRTSGAATVKSGKFPR